MSQSNILNKVPLKVAIIGVGVLGVRIVGELVRCGAVVNLYDISGVYNLNLRLKNEFQRLSQFKIDHKCINICETFAQISCGKPGFG